MYNILIIYYCVGNCSEFPDMGDDLPSCILEMATKNVQINFLYQRAKSYQIFPIFRKIPVLVWHFCHFEAPLDD